jgi:hypothetical protein
MADKEATVFVIDLGASMSKREHGRDVTNLGWCMQYVWDKVTSKVPPLNIASNPGPDRQEDRCRWRRGFSHGPYPPQDSLLMIGTDNELSKEEGYHNIMVLLPIQQYVH